jgi:hypothetical protein
MGREYRDFFPPDDADSLDELMDEAESVACNCAHDDIVQFGGQVVARICACRIDADHATALERERVDAWLESIILGNWLVTRESFDPDVTHWEMRVLGGDSTPETVIAAIRAGAHHQQLPPTGTETGPGATQASEGSTDASGTVSGRETGAEGRGR